MCIRDRFSPHAAVVDIARYLVLSAEMRALCSFMCRTDDGDISISGGRGDISESAFYGPGTELGAVLASFSTPTTCVPVVRRGLRAHTLFISLAREFLAARYASFQAGWCASTLRGANVIGHASVPERPKGCLLYTSPSPRDLSTSRMPSSA